MFVTLSLSFHKRISSAISSKAPLVLGFAYVTTLGQPAHLFLPDYLLALLVLLACVGAAYWWHDLLDKQEDAQKNTLRAWQSLSKWVQWGVLALWVLLAGLPWFKLPSSAYTGYLLGAEAVLLLAYSLRPIRLKDYPLWGALCDAGYAYSLPSVLSSYTFMLLFEAVDFGLLALIGVWMLLLGVRHYLNQLCLDFVWDQAYRKQLRYNPTRLKKIILRTILPLEGGAMAGFFSYYLASYWAHVNYFNGVLLLGAMAYGLCMAGQVLLRDNYSFQHIALDSYYVLVLPFVWLFASLASLTSTASTTSGTGVVAQPQEFAYGLVLGLHMLFFTQYWQKAYHLAFPLASKIANYGAYYFKRYLLKQPLPRALGEHYPSYVRDQAIAQRTHEKFAIAIINKNKNKYTETYIQHTLERFSQGVYYLWGEKGPHHLPHRWGDGRPVGLRKAWQVQDKTARDKAGLCHFLKRHNIQVLVAHFGPTGVHMLDIAQGMGLPLIVYFHGYDVHHAPTWAQYEADYKRLFKHSYALLAASQGIASKLIQAGASPERIHWLPAYVHLAACDYIDHSHFAPNILFVGRFCEVKSPHLLLVAFAQVLQSLPHATLSLIGEGHLQESCEILSQALGLAPSVRFLGACSHQETLAHMRQARTLVLPSLTTPYTQDKEGTPVVVLEACALGLPLVASQHEGIQELLRHEQEALLVPCYNLDKLAQAMLRLCTDDALAQGLAKQAHRRLHEHKNITQHMVYLEQLIEDAQRLYTTLNPYFKQ